jgi:NhaP-type Na+/H+ or K+/H+ antiporter
VDHGIDTASLVALSLSALLWALASARLDRWSVTSALTFVALGVVMANEPLAFVDLHADSGTVRTLAELTLAVLLFCDAATVDLRRLRAEAEAPARLLLVGLPLTVAAGTGLALALFSDLDPWACAAVAAIVAPTDAALGAPLMADRRIPARVRQVLNVESGLNDGLVTPIVTFCIAAVVAELGDRPDLSPASAFADLGGGVLVGVAVGLVAGVAVIVTSRAGWMEREAAAVTGLAPSLLAYGAAVHLGANGFVAAFAGGLAFGASADLFERRASGAAARRDAVAEGGGGAAAPGIAPRATLRFAAEVGEVLAATVWFIFGAVAVDILRDAGDGWAVAAFAFSALTVARLVPVAIALTGTGVPPATVAFVGWFGPRGLASVVFALIAYDELAGDPSRATVLAAVTATVLMSVVAHGLTARPLAARYARAVAPRARAPVGGP